MLRTSLDDVRRRLGFLALAGLIALAAPVALAADEASWSHVPDPVAEVPQQDGTDPALEGGSSPSSLDPWEDVLPIPRDDVLPDDILSDEDQDETDFAALEAEFAEPDGAVDFRDPFERMNRMSFGFNRGLDRFVVRPLARSYGWVVPDRAKGPMRRFLGNLRLPIVLVNEILQLRPIAAAGTTGRFSVNTTVGLLGFFDPASRVGLEGRSTGFGDTLAFYRVPSGPYVVIPLFGPSRPRDAVGGFTDFFLRADTLLLGLGGGLMFASGDAIAQRQEYDPLLRSLEASSVDPYETTRVAYMMSRDFAASAPTPRDATP